MTEGTMTAEDELDKQFPKGDKARGRALVLHAVHELEKENTLSKHNEEIGKMKTEYGQQTSLRDKAMREYSMEIYELEQKIKNIDDKLLSLKAKYEKGCGIRINKRDNVHCGEKVGMNRYWCKEHQDYKAKLSAIEELQK